MTTDNQAIFQLDSNCPDTLCRHFCIFFISPTTHFFNSIFNLPHKWLIFFQRLLQKYLPTLTHLQQSLDFDELIAFGKKIDAFSDKHKLAQLKEYCNLLNDSTATFKTEKIYDTLKEISYYINKEIQCKL